MLSLVSTYIRYVKWCTDIQAGKNTNTDKNKGIKCSSQVLVITISSIAGQRPCLEVEFLEPAQAPSMTKSKRRLWQMKFPLGGHISSCFQYCLWACVCMYVCMFAYASACMWKPEVNLMCFFYIYINLIFLKFYFRQSLSLGLVLCGQWGQWFPGLCSYPLPQLYSHCVTTWPTLCMCVLGMSKSAYLCSKYFIDSLPAVLFFFPVYWL